MSIDSHDDSCWKLDRSTALLVDENVSARVNLADPHRGLEQLEIQGNSISGQFLCISALGAKNWSPAISDAYVRGRDLVVSYGAVDDWPFAPQICWRAEAGMGDNGPLASLFVLLSIQTDLLDTHPQFEIASRLATEEMLQLHIGDGGDAVADNVVTSRLTAPPQVGVACSLRRLSGGRASVAEVMPASDYRELRFGPPSGGSSSETAWRLSAGFLEKGVIRRARLAVSFLPRRNDLQLATEFARAIKRRPLPLTT